MEKIGYNSDNKNVYNSIGNIYIEDEDNKIKIQKDENKLLTH